MSMQRLYAGTIEQVGEDEVAGLCITGGVARDGDAWLPAGIDLSAYKRNPIVLRNHDPDQVIGTAVAIGLTPDQSAVAIRIQFAPPGASSVADEARALAKCGALRGISAGIDPLESEPLHNGTRGVRITRAELLEVSLVAVPASSDALITARAYRSRAGAAAMLRALPPLNEAAMRRALDQVGRSRTPEKPIGLMSPQERAVLEQNARTAHALSVWGLGEANRERERTSFEQRQADLRRLTDESTH